MKSGDGFVQAYNCQAMVDDAHQIIVAEAVTNQPPDVEHLVPMIVRTVENCGMKPAKLVADTGYDSEANVCETMKWGIDPYIATGRHHHDEQVIAPRGRPPAGLSTKETMARKLATKSGAAIYSRRKVIVEPVFGQIKELEASDASSSARSGKSAENGPSSPSPTISSSYTPTHSNPPGLPAGPQAASAGGRRPRWLPAASRRTRRGPPGRPPGVTETRS